MQKMMSAVFSPGRERVIGDILLREPAQRVLDFGAGYGDLVFKLAAIDPDMEIWGCDIDAEAMAVARAQAPHNAHFEAISPFGAWPWPDQFFDAVILGDVLEHVPDESFILVEAARVLRSCGRVIVTVPHQSVTGSLDPSNFRFRWPTLHRLTYTLAHGAAAYRLRYTTAEPFNSSPGVTWHRHYRLSELGPLVNAAELTVEDAIWWGILDPVKLAWEMLKRNLSAKPTQSRVPSESEGSKVPSLRPAWIAYNMALIARRTSASEPAGSDAFPR